MGRVLDVLIVGDHEPGKRGGMVIVLLHGWGDSAEGIASLAWQIRPPGSLVVVPDGPVPHPFGGRGWWDLDSNDRPSWAWDIELPAGYQENAGVLEARLATLRLVAELRTRHEPDAVAVVGFSQGAMLALDIGLQRESAVDQVVALSGVLLADSIPALLDPAPVRPRFLLAHGLEDEVVASAGGETARDLLQHNGCVVKWHPFSGGHDVPGDVAATVRSFLADATDH